MIQKMAAVLMIVNTFFTILRHFICELFTRESGEGMPRRLHKEDCYSYQTVRTHVLHI